MTSHPSVADPDQAGAGSSAGTLLVERCTCREAAAATDPAAQRGAPASAIPSCHDDSGGGVAPVGSPVVALAGAPNVGKSTLFNALTGARRTMGNWPGTTVEVGRGAWRRGDRTYDLIDLPGAYSLDPLSPDEALTRELLIDTCACGRPDLVVVAADAAHLSRSLYLVAQLREHAYRIVVAVTMVDVAARRSVTLDATALAQTLGCPVVLVDPRRRDGMAALADAVAGGLAGPPIPPRTDHRDAEEQAAGVDGVVTEPTVEGADDLEFARADERFAWVDEALQRAVTHSGEHRVSISDRIDAVVLSRLGGPIIFAAVMWLVFQLTTTVAAPMQDFLDKLIVGPISDGARSLLTLVHLDHPLVVGLLVDGLIAGVGMVLTFLPLMAIMFLLLALLEDSGYMARAAVVADRSMRAIGLPGRAFLPLIVGFGCNVPAISATRVLGGARQRVLTALLVPFTSCTARLTVYVMLATTFFADLAGTVVFIMYAVSILLVVLVGLALRKTLWRTMGNEPLVLDLPPYQRPTLRVMSSVTWTRLQGFLRTATGIIVATVCAVWLLQSVPAGTGDPIGEVPVEHSAYASVARTVAPVFEPLGFDNWQTTGALVTGFVAKEAVLSSWAQTYALDDSTEAGAAGLSAAVDRDFTQSSHGHPIPAVLAFMVFLLAYTPCVATLAAQRREIGLRWTAFGVAMQLTTAYLLGLAVFQIGRIWW